MEGYGQDLAAIHDTGYNECARAAGPALIRLLHQQNIRAGRIVELGCGSGWTAQQLLSAGFEVVGVDQSAAMIELARRRAPQAAFHQASLFAFDLPRCCCALSVGECCNYLFDGEDRGGRLQDLFARVAAALEPGGLFLFDLAEPGQVAPGSVAQSYVEGDGWFVLTERQEDYATRILSRRIVSFRRESGLYRRAEELHHQRLYTRDEVRSALAATGLRLRRQMRGYGHYELPPGRTVYVAGKPAGDIRA